MRKPTLFSANLLFTASLVCGSAAVAADGAGYFPRTFEVAGVAVTVQPPRVSDWPGFKVLRGGLLLEPRAQRVGFEADTAVDFESRRVRLQNLRLDGSDGQPVAGLAEALRDSFDDGRVTVGLDWLLDALPSDFVIPRAATAAPQLNFNPPRIVVSDRPRRLMLIDGPPATVRIPATRLEFVVNTDWDVFHDTAGGRWYVLDGGRWISNSMLSSGDWRETTELPDDFLTLQLNSDWPQVAAALPPRTGPRPLPITISYEPTELVLIDGEMQLEAIGGGGLLYVANTSSDLFRYRDRYYYLAAGRWFHSRSLDRQWFAVRDLPRAFAEIPLGHAKAHVLAAVPGTPAARRAAIEAAIPRIATVAPGAGGALAVPYLGEPAFVEIQGTPLRRAENTPLQVIQHNNFFYLCLDGAWYAASDPHGPWAAAREIPQAIYSIPPTDPAYNVTFVELDTFDPNTGRAAYVSTSGYYNRYYTGSTMVYGTGWYSPGYHHGSAYWRYPYTYGQYGPWGAYWPYVVPMSGTREIERREADWEWDLDGGKRRVYDYGPRNRVGERYVAPPGAGYPKDGGG